MKTIKVTKSNTPTFLYRLITLNSMSERATSEGGKSEKLRHLLSEFDRKTKKSKIVNKPDKVFFIEDFKHQRIYFINTVYNWFIKYYSKKFKIIETIEVKNKCIPQRLKKVDIKQDYQPRDYQELYIEKITTTKEPTVLVDLQTGKGKSFIATYSMIKRGKKFALLVLPRYIEKWIKDITEYTNITKDEILVIKGRAMFNYIHESSKSELRRYKVLFYLLQV